MALSDSDKEWIDTRIFELNDAIMEGLESYATKEFQEKRLTETEAVLRLEISSSEKRIKKELREEIKASEERIIEAFKTAHKVTNKRIDKLEQIVQSI